MSGILIAAVVLIGFAAGLFGFGILIRNEWVFTQRTRLLHEAYGDYQRLPSYDTMMWRFWVWDIRKFLK